MRQDNLFSDVCETLSNTSGSDADLTVNTSTEETGQTPIEEIECIKCNIVQDISHFYVMPSGEIKRTCRSCKNGHQALLKQLKKENEAPPDDYTCPICTRGIQEIGAGGQKRLQGWVLDHCHETETFRGWICHHCNTGLGGFSDNPDRVARALTYLEEHRLQHGL